MNETFIITVQGQECRVPRALYDVMRNQPELLVTAFDDSEDSTVRLSTDLDGVFHVRHQGVLPDLLIERRVQDGAFIARVQGQWWEVDRVVMLALGLCAPFKGDSQPAWSLYHAACECLYGVDAHPFDTTE